MLFYFVLLIIFYTNALPQMLVHDIASTYAFDLAGATVIPLLNEKIIGYSIVHRCIGRIHVHVKAVSSIRY